MTKEEAITILSDIRSEYNCFSHVEGGRYHALSMGIEALKERKHGNWLITDRYHDFMDGTELIIWKCSECGDEFSLEGERPTKKYCSNCRARMAHEESM